MSTQAQVEVRLGSHEDLEALSRLEQDSGGARWSAASLQEELHNANARVLVATRQNEILGFAVCWLVPGEAQLQNIVVARGHRRQGIGSRLLREVIALARRNESEQLILELRPSNVAARFLYENSGFVPLGRRSHYYREPREDALVMALRLI